MASDGPLLPSGKLRPQRIIAVENKRIWTHEEDYIAWFDCAISVPHAASMRRLGGGCFPESVVLSSRYHDIVTRTTISLSLVQRDLDIQRSLNVVRAAIEQASLERHILPGGSAISVGPIGEIEWVLDDGIPVAISTYAAIRLGRTLVFSDDEFPYDEYFWADFWILRATHPKDRI